jgi:predicted FMN-binding regulatory protein PaiB
MKHSRQSSTWGATPKPSASRSWPGLAVTETLPKPPATAEPFFLNHPFTGQEVILKNHFATNNSGTSSPDPD